MRRNSLVLSKAESGPCSKAQLLKHKSLLVLLMAADFVVYRSVRLQDLDFDENNSKLYKVKERKDRYVPLSIHLMRGLNTLQLKNQ
jgi:integrase